MDVDLVRFLERRAAALHIPYTHVTAPQALLELVSDAEHKDIRTRGPDSMPDCFGQMFAGPYDPDCSVCQVQTACMARLAWVRMPKVASEIASDDAARLGAALELDPKAVALAQTFAAQAAGKDTGVFEGYTQLAPPPKPKIVSMHDIPRPFGLAAHACLLGSRARMKVWDRDVRQTVRVATPKLLGMARVAYFRPPPKSEAWMARYTRERKRNRLYSQLKVGMVLRKVYHGVLHEVRVAYRGYEYEGQSYPTLYAVVQAIAPSIACQHEPDDTGRRAPGVKNTAMQSPKIFFRRSFVALANRMPAKKRRKKKK